MLGSDDFRRSLNCIRCGACMNTCPVYRRSGGHSYGVTFAGPIGSIINPALNLRKFSALPFACTLCGSCTDVCPVKINIHEQIYKWREIINERNQLPIVKKEAMRMAGKVLASPALSRTAVKAANSGLDYLPRTMIYNPLNAWGRQREVPKTPKQTFRDWYLKTGAKENERLNTEHPEFGKPRRNSGPSAQEPAGLAADARSTDLQSGLVITDRDLQGRTRADGGPVSRCLGG